MDHKVLQMQQYLDVHPVLGRGDRLRVKYVELLGYFLGKYGVGDLRVKQLASLYACKITGLDAEVGFRGKELNQQEQFQFFKYRFFILTDSLFILAFDDREKGGRICEDVISFCGDRNRKKLEMMRDAFYSEGVDSFSEEFGELRKVYEVVWANRRFLRKPLRRIMITANMSAGKSTLLNALAGKKVHKTLNLSCTAKIHYMYNKPGYDGMVGKIDGYLDLDASLDRLMTDNVLNDTPEIAVGTGFRTPGEYGGRLCFIDTPGVNSSMDAEHQRISADAIKSVSCDLLMYLFNGENIGSDDDKIHLEFVREKYGGRIIFLVNRLDKYKEGDKDSIRETLAEIDKDLRRMGFDNPAVYPLSAYAAYLAKMSMYGEELSEDEQGEIARLRRRLRKDDFSFERYYPVKVGADFEDKSIGELLLHSGVLSLERLLYQ